MDSVISVILYLVTLVYLIVRAVRDGLTHDRISEWWACQRIYLAGWVVKGTLESCFIPVILPYYILTLLRKPEWGEIIFKVIPCFFHALAPAFVYLIGREFLSPSYAAIAVIFLLCQPIFLRNPNEGRVSVGLGISAVLVWSLLQRDLPLCIFISSMLVLSYYSAAFLWLGVGIIASLLLFPSNESIVIFATVIITLIVTRVWYGFIFTGANDSISHFLSRILLIDGWRTRGMGDTVERQEPIIREAMGQGFNNLPLARKILIAVNWLFQSPVLIGAVFCSTFGVSDTFVAIVLGSYFVLIGCFLIPQGVYFGVVRTYFLSLPVLAPCFVFGILKTAEFMNWNPYIVLGVIVPVLVRLMFVRD